jgi:hypothetical protein
MRLFGMNRIGKGKGSSRCCELRLDDVAKVLTLAIPDLPPRTSLPDSLLRHASSLLRHSSCPSSTISFNPLDPQCFRPNRLPYPNPIHARRPRYTDETHHFEELVNLLLLLKTSGKVRVEMVLLLT